MRRFNGLIILAVCGILLTASAAQAVDEDKPSIKTTISRKRILVGDRIRYKAQISSGLDLEIEFPKFKDNRIEECEVKDSGKEVRRSFFGGHRDYINWLDITSYYIGKRKIPPIEIKYRQIGEGNWKALKTDELYFTVESVLTRNTPLYDIKDIKGPLYPFSFLKLFAWFIAGLLALWASIKLFKRFRKKASPKLPYQIAIEALEAAIAEFSKTGDVKEYYVRISDAVRRYIETVFKVRAPEMTTQEFLASLGGSRKISAEYQELLKVFMEACDLVKFAKHAPLKEEIDSVFTTAKKFIEETKGEFVVPV